MDAHRILLPSLAVDLMAGSRRCVVCKSVWCVSNACGQHVRCGVVLACARQPTPDRQQLHHCNTGQCVSACFEHHLSEPRQLDGVNLVWNNLGRCVPNPPVVLGGSGTDINAKVTEINNAPTLLGSEVGHQYCVRTKTSPALNTATLTITAT